MNDRQDGTREVPGRVRRSIRVLAVAALVVAAVSVFALVRSPAPYVVHARFTDASQLVKGDRVQVSGQVVGQVTAVELASDGQAEITLHVDKDYAPLREGTTASVRLRSLLGVANRYVDLKLPPAGAHKLPSGTVLDTDHTQSAVDFDVVLDLLTPKVRKSLQRVIAGSAKQFDGQGITANEGLMYLAPALSTTDALTSELARDKPRLARFIERGQRPRRRHRDRTQPRHRPHPAPSGNRQRAGRSADRAEAYGRWPARLHAAGQDDVREPARQPHRAAPAGRRVEAGRPQARPVPDRPARVRSRRAPDDPRPVAHGQHAGREQRPVRPDRRRARAARHRDLHQGPQRQAPPRRLPVTTSALKQATPELTFARPYAVDLTGWFNDFGTSGVYDALGGASRASTSAGAFQLLAGTLFPIPPDMRAEAFQRTALLGYLSRCPGADERDPGDHSTPYVPPGVTCDPKEVPPGP